MANNPPGAGGGQSGLAALVSVLALRAPANLAYETAASAATLLAFGYIALVLLVDTVETRFFWDRYKGTPDQPHVQTWLLIAWELAVAAALVHAWATFHNFAARRLTGPAYTVGICCALLLMLTGFGLVGLFLHLSGSSYSDPGGAVYLPLLAAVLWIVYMLWRVEAETS
jgi:hypothetical protein